MIDARGSVYPTPEARMGLAVELSRLSMENGGGPFGAGVFDMESHRLIAPGVNLVMQARCSMAHAEVVAMSLAQRVLGSHDLAAPGLPACELVASTEPCLQCYGAVHWSGVAAVSYGASTADAEAIGFHEGVKPEGWQRGLRERGIQVEGGRQAEAASRVLREYARRGLPVYNSRLGA